MPSQCSTQTIYQSLLNSLVTDSTPSLVLLTTILPLQFILMVFVFLKGYRKLRKIHMRRQCQWADQSSQYARNAGTRQKQMWDQQLPGDNFRNQSHSNAQPDLIEKIFCQHSSKTKILLTSICFLLLFLVSLILLLLSFLAIYQISFHTYNQTQCQLTKNVHQFRKGTENWIGLENLVSNVTQLNLVLNTRIQVSINAIKGLMLNGTAAKIKPGLGFANGTNITVVNQQSPFNRTILQSTSVKMNINASVRYWLFMNSSLSNMTLFPVCQPNMTYPIQHPLVSEETIELNYMDDICEKVTKEVDELVENGGKVDKLLEDLEEVKARKTSLETNLSALSEVYSPISSRTNEYASEFSSLEHDFSAIWTLSIVGLASYGGVGTLMVLYFIVMFSIECCGSQSPQAKQQSEEQSSINVVITVRGQGMMKQNQNRRVKLEAVSSSVPKLFLLFLFGINTIVGIESYLSVEKSIQLIRNCQDFSEAVEDTDAFNILPLDSSQKQLLAPIQQCTSNKSIYFMQSVPLITSRFTLENLFSLSATYNASVPKDVFQSSSLTNIQTLKQYLFHLETMPIKSTQFNLLELLHQVNLYSNGSYPNSKQIQQCGRAVIQDQYVYNSVDCKHRLMDLVSEASLSEPRCIILPTYDGTPGTATTHLNEAQHTFVLDVTCPSINNMFSPTNSSCFLAKRLALLQAQNCTNTANQLATRLENLVKFSQKASQYTDIYMQNLRNLFGIYAVSSTNLTQFFAGANMSETMGAFGVLSNNLLNKTKCDQIKPIVDSVLSSYCSNDNSMPKILSEAYVWGIIVVVSIFVQSMIFFLLDVCLRIYRIEKFYGKIGPINQGKKVLPQRGHPNIIEISQQTLVRDNLRQDDRIYRDEFNRVPQQSPLHGTHPIIIVAQATEHQTQQVQPKFNNSLSLDQTGLLFDKYTPSPMKSINPYGNTIDQVIEYPKTDETLRKQQHVHSLGIKPDKKPEQKEISLFSSIKKGNLIKDQIFDEKDSSIESKKQEQIKQSGSRQSHQRQGKLRMSQTARRFKKVNIETDEKKIMPQLFFNLDERDGQHIQKSKCKIRCNNKTQNINGEVDRGLELGMSRNILQFNLHEQEKDERLCKEIEVMNLQKIRKAKQSKERGRKKEDENQAQR